MFKRRNNDRVEVPVGDDNLPALYRSLKTDDCFNQEVELLNVAEVAEVLRVSVSSVRRLQQRRRIPFLKLGGSVRFAKHDIISYLARQRIETVE